MALTPPAHPGPPLSASAILADAPALPLTDARSCSHCGGDGYELDDGKKCRVCKGHGKTCADCYGFLADSHPDTVRCAECAAFDAVYAAGLTCAALTDEEHGDPA